MADTQNKFKKANNGRSPSPAETEHCALRNKNHPSAPVSSSTIFLEQLSHQLGRNQGVGNSTGSDFLISHENPEFSRSLHCPIETFERFNQIEDIQTRLLIQKKREALKANIKYLLKKDSKLKRLKTDEKIQDVLTEISKREISLAQKYIKAKEKIRIKLVKLRDKKLRKIESAQKTAYTNLSESFSNNSKNAQKMEDTRTFNIYFSNYKYLINTIAKNKNCRKQPDSLKNYDSDYIRLTGLTRTQGWQAPDNKYLFTTECIKEMKTAQANFEQNTNGLKIFADFIPDGENYRDIEIEDEMKKVVTSPITLFQSFNFDDGDDRNKLLKFGGATSHHNEVLRLREKYQHKRKKFKKKREKIKQKFTDDMLKAETLLARKMKNDLSKLRNTQALNSNMRALMALDQLAKKPRRNSIFLKSLSRLQKCESLGGDDDLSSLKCGH